MPHPQHDIRESLKGLGTHCQNLKMFFFTLSSPSASTYTLHSTFFTAIAFDLILIAIRPTPLHALIMNISVFSLSLLLWASTATASGRYCSWPSVYTIASQTAVWTDPELVAGVFVGPSSTTGTIAAGYTYTKSWTITGGITGTYAL